MMINPNILAAGIGFLGGVIGGLIAIGGSVITIHLKNKIYIKNKKNDILKVKYIDEGLTVVLDYLRLCNSYSFPGSDHSDHIKYNDLTIPTNEALSIGTIIGKSIDKSILEVDNCFKKLIKENNDTKDMNSFIKGHIAELEYYYQRLILNPIPNWFNLFLWKMFWKLKKSR